MAVSLILLRTIVLSTVCIICLSLVLTIFRIVTMLLASIIHLTYLFWMLAESPTFTHTGEDMETLNRMAMNGSVQINFVENPLSMRCQSHSLSRDQNYRTLGGSVLRRTSENNQGNYKHAAKSQPTPGNLLF